MSLRCALGPLLAVVSCLGAAKGDAQDAGAVKASYVKTEYQIPMRDGKRLFTAVYSPRDTTRRYPIMITRTPYGVGP